MLFSCLKDADCLDNEAFLEPDINRVRGNVSGFATAKKRGMTIIYIPNSSQAEKTTLNDLRTSIREECIEPEHGRPLVLFPYRTVRVEVKRYHP
jgi:hypothetical protein